jgi:hypothetical protein
MSRRRFTAPDAALPTHELQIANLRDGLERAGRQISLLLADCSVARARVAELERHRCAACQAMRTEAGRAYTASLARSAVR